jgi:predicted flap endonuclease-1-like 5' DNA nuclease
MQNNQLNVLAAQNAFSFLARKRELEMKKAVGVAEIESGSVKKSPLKEIPGIGNTAVETLNKAGIYSVEDVKFKGEEVLKKLVNPVTLKQIKNYLKDNEQEAK